MPKAFDQLSLDMNNTLFFSHENERESAVVFDQVFLNMDWVQLILFSSSMKVKGKERASALVFDQLFLNMDWVQLILFSAGMKVKGKERESAKSF